MVKLSNNFVTKLAKLLEMDFNAKIVNEGNCIVYNAFFQIEIRSWGHYNSITILSIRNSEKISASVNGMINQQDVLQKVRELMQDQALIVTYMQFEEQKYQLL